MTKERDRPERALPLCPFCLSLLSVQAARRSLNCGKAGRAVSGGQGICARRTKAASRAPPTLLLPSLPTTTSFSPPHSSLFPPRPTASLARPAHLPSLLRSINSFPSLAFPAQHGGFFFKRRRCRPRRRLPHLARLVRPHTFFALITELVEPGLESGWESSRFAQRRLLTRSLLSTTATPTPTPTSVRAKTLSGRALEMLALVAPFTHACCPRYLQVFTRRCSRTLSGRFRTAMRSSRTPTSSRTRSSSTSVAVSLASRLPGCLFLTSLSLAQVGCGTGILSMFAAKAGAKHVYGVRPCLYVRVPVAQTAG